LHLLVVEDSSVNQKVVSCLLRKQGHTFTLAKNGLEAVDAYAHETFDAVLMDVQMPGMDGLEATRRIRAMEAGTTRVPIVAMTAHVMKGDRERCQEAGMDSYLPKPIDLDELNRQLAAWTAPHSAPRGLGLCSATGRNSCPMSDLPPKPAAAPATVAPPPVLDRAEALARVGGDEQLLGELIRIFQTDAPGWLADARLAIGSQDALTLRRAAHTIKGAASSLGALQTVVAASRLEDMARHQIWTGTADALAELEQTLARLEAETASFAPKL
jgi:CheY-like chemotaxis protein